MVPYPQSTLRTNNVKCEDKNNACIAQKLNHADSFLFLLHPLVVDKECKKMVEVKKTLLIIIPMITTLPCASH